MTQIRMTYTRQHKFEMLENNLLAWSKELPFLLSITSDIHRKSNHDHQTENLSSDNLLPWKIQGCQNNNKPISLAQFSELYGLPDLQELTHYYFIKNILYDPVSNADTLLTYAVFYYNTLRVSVCSHDKRTFIIHYIRSTGPKRFRNGSPRADWVWLRRRPRSSSAPPGSLNGKVPARLNAIFRLQGPLGIYLFFFI